jgi:hypothetical protein
MSRRARRHYEVRKYGFWNFVLDVLLVCITSGLWLIWIFVREMRRRG